MHLAHRSVRHEKLAHAYLDAKKAVISSGFASEIDWQEDVSLKDLTETVFLKEYTWVVFSSGFRELTLRKKFSEIAKAFFYFESANQVLEQPVTCRDAALKAFHNVKKVDAVFFACRWIQKIGFSEASNYLNQEGVNGLRSLPFMGPATSYHLAKNLGLEVVKPDRHLIRAAAAAGYESPHELCRHIQDIVGDALSVIDIVIWRYAVLYPTRHESYWELKN